MHLPDREQMAREHAAWLDVGQEFKRLDLDMDENGNALLRAIHKWGEELAQLRMGDPEIEHAVNALAEKRQAYEGQFERGEYPAHIA